MEGGLPTSSDVQVVIVIDEEDGALQPLTSSHTPRSLLPVGNRKLLCYQLDMLYKYGARDIIIVASRSLETPIMQILSEYVNDTVTVQVVLVDHMTGTAHGIREAQSKIRGDFVYMTADSICQVYLPDMLNYHRSKGADVTMLFSSRSRYDEEEEMVILTEENRLVMKTFLEDMEDEDWCISKALLQKAGNTTIRQDLVDMGIAFCSSWVLSFIIRNDKYSCMSSEVLPYLIHRQFMSSSELLRDIPDLSSKGKSCDGLNSYVVRQQLSMKSSMSYSGSDLASLMTQDVSLMSFLPDCISRNSSADALSFSDMSGSFSPFRSDSIGSSESGSRSPRNNGLNRSPSFRSNKDKEQRSSVDLLRCFAWVLDSTNPASVSENSMGMSNSHSHSHSQSNASSKIAIRISNISSYLAANKELPPLLYSKETLELPWEKNNESMKYHANNGTLVGANVETGEKALVKQCCVGNNVKIGAKCKIFDSVLLDNVVIMDNCEIQKSVISSGVTIEASCSLEECVVASDCKISSKNKIKSELITESL